MKRFTDMFTNRKWCTNTPPCPKLKVTPTQTTDEDVAPPPGLQGDSNRNSDLGAVPGHRRPAEGCDRQPLMPNRAHIKARPPRT
ncbi:hypothetical protein AOLI_G00027720 [Acnodon oligacanthus]